MLRVMKLLADVKGHRRYCGVKDLSFEETPSAEDPAKTMQFRDGF
jgi:hypothetical protein